MYLYLFGFEILAYFPYVTRNQFKKKIKTSRINARLNDLDQSANSHRRLSLRVALSLVSSAYPCA